MQREIQKHLTTPSPSTKSQLALAQGRQEGKQAQKKKSRQVKDIENQRKYNLKRENKTETS